MTFAEDGRAVQRPVRREADLDALPRPARDAVPDILANDGLVAISTSRGCYARCTFCSVPRFFGLEAGHKHASGAWLSRSPACVVEEMRDLKNRFGIIELLFVDDEFFGGSEAGKRRAEELAARLIEADLGIRFAISCRAENVEEALFARLQAAGLSHVFIGIESGVAQALKLFAKSQTLDDSRRAIATVKRLGLSFQAGFMAFNHQSTLADIRLNLDFLEEIGEAKPYNFNTAAAPYRGTPLADKVARDGMMTDAARRTATGFLDLHVALAREAAAEIAAAAAPFIGAIAALQSAITYQWRRDVPARSDETRRVVNALEAAINAELFQMMRETVETLESQPAISGATLLDDLRARLGTWRKSKEGSVALVCAWVRQKEGEVRYWTQSDLIAHPQEHANA
ncbi:B12-binding domain-containing radical SAM protein [Sinorhizobium sojae]|uniref:B12-binding domain-containing radical SAM protein n=1 Tax=Sinorhizobium sojae TaxID=716925 RepID=UPI001FCBA59D|nr:radical SAM protein [Sinorhizobium sojae]